MKKGQKMTKEQRQKISDGKRINLIGKRFGKLVVISLSKEKGVVGQVKWDCKCDCGSLHTVTGESLRSGKSKSCGCWRRQNPNLFKKHKDRKKVLLKKQYSAIIKRHKYRWSQEEIIPFELFCELSYQSCKYCGRLAKNGKKIEDYLCDHKKKKQLTETVLFINGIDRVDSSMGYVANNVVTCCTFCNRAKNDASENEFLKWVKDIYEFNFT